jgi:hypothetical protein
LLFATTTTTTATTLHHQHREQQRTKKHKICQILLIKHDRKTVEAIIQYFLFEIIGFNKIDINDLGLKENKLSSI